MFQHGGRCFFHYQKVNSVRLEWRSHCQAFGKPFWLVHSRSITTQSLDGICAVINNAATCFEGDFITALRTPLKAGYPSGYIDLAQAYNAFQTSIQQGKIQTSDTEQARTHFIIQLNNADMSTEYIETLWMMMGEEIRGAFPAMSVREGEILDSCLSGLKSVRDTLKAVVDFGLQQLRSSAVKPRLHTWIDQFISHNHELTEVICESAYTRWLYLKLNCA